MAQAQGLKGRLDGANCNTTVAAADFAIGAGWGNTATVSAVGAGSNDQRGTVTISTNGSGFAQATATVTLTFKDGAYASAPFALVQITANTNAVAEAQPTSVTPGTTTLAWTHSVLPVTGKTYTFTYVVIS